MTIDQIEQYVNEVQAAGSTILGVISVLDPAEAAPAAVASEVITLLAKMASVALQAWSDASQTPITIEAIQALLPNATPLTPPDATA